MDDGTLQAVRGQVTVRANGSKKVTSEFDLVGTVEPAVMFSRLIQELFPDELKIKLLQGASLEEPLFGPAGKLPKITREPRLPEAEPDQLNPEIPIEPKQSIVPLPSRSACTPATPLHKQFVGRGRMQAQLNLCVDPHRGGPPGSHCRRGSQQLPVH